MKFKTIAVTVAVFSVLLPSLGQAQLLGPFTNSNASFSVDANGLMAATGTLGTGTLSLNGVGTRMFWYPGKGAFRAGTVDNYYGTGSGIYWDDANIGQSSFAIGIDTKASGTASAAFGRFTSATGTYSTAFGSSSTASGFGSTALGESTASGLDSTSFGSANAIGNYSTAFGRATTAFGAGSFAMGQYSMANGDNSVAAGLGTSATGIYSAAFGLVTQANSYASFSVGAATVGGGSTTSWVASDPLFEVGNGKNGSYGNPSATGPADALVVYKNGIVAVHKEIRTAAAGDLSMGSFTAGTAP